MQDSCQEAFFLFGEGVRVLMCGPLGSWFLNQRSVHDEGRIPAVRGIPEAVSNVFQGASCQAHFKTECGDTCQAWSMADPAKLQSPMETHAMHGAGRPSVSCNAQWGHMPCTELAGPAKQQPPWETHAMHVPEARGLSMSHPRFEHVTVSCVAKLRCQVLESRRFPCKCV